MYAVKPPTESAYLILHASRVRENYDSIQEFKIWLIIYRIKYNSNRPKQNLFSRFCSVMKERILLGTGLILKLGG